jgi:hypothetical protein
MSRALIERKKRYYLGVWKRVLLWRRSTTLAVLEYQG